jgi:hypothetical protein
LADNPALVCKNAKGEDEAGICEGDLADEDVLRDPDTGVWGCK